jgi:hypothetical protein
MEKGKRNLSIAPDQAYDNSCDQTQSSVEQ